MISYILSTYFINTPRWRLLHPLMLVYELWHILLFQVMFLLFIVNIRCKKEEKCSNFYGNENRTDTLE